MNSSVTFMEYLHFEINRYRKMKVSNVTIAIISFIIFYFFSLMVFDFYMKIFLKNYVIDVNEIESYKGLFSFVNFNLCHFFIFTLINIISLIIYKTDLIPEKYRIQKKWPWENENVINSKNNNIQNANDKNEKSKTNSNEIDSHQYSKMLITGIILKQRQLKQCLLIFLLLFL